MWSARPSHDGSDGRESGYEYAVRAVSETAGDPAKLAERLADFDDAVATETAAILRKRSPGSRSANTFCLRVTTCRRGIETHLNEWKPATWIEGGSASLTAPSARPTERRRSPPSIRCGMSGRTPLRSTFCVQKRTSANWQAAQTGSAKGPCFPELFGVRTLWIKRPG
jgi:hypothetical protein